VIIMFALCLALAMPAVISPAAAPQSAEQTIADWPQTPKTVATEMIAKYGQPAGITADRLIWLNKGPWREIIVYRKEVPHDFPKSHTDLLQQVVNYRVPADKYDELAAYDGSVIVERTKGTMAARCDREDANILALNLADDIVKGKKTVQEARQAYGEAIKALMRGEKPAITQSLQFSTMQNTNDLDVSII